MSQFNRYDHNPKYLKKHGAYLITLQKHSPRQPGIYDIVQDGGDRALPLGFVNREKNVYAAFHYSPLHNARVEHGQFIAAFTTMDEAIDAVLNTPRKPPNYDNPEYGFGYMQGRGAS